MKSYRVLTLSLPLVMGLLLLAGMFSSLALAQEPARGESQQVWLILDTARPLEEVLPPLLAELEKMQQSGWLEEYAGSPERSGAGAAPGLAVTARPQVLPLLARLPGVLAVLEELPPALEPGVGIQAATLITGLVTVEGSSTAIPDVYVGAYDALTFMYAGDGLDGPTDAAGQYAITASPASGKVKLWFFASGPYVDEWWNDKDSFATADAITAAGGVVQDVNAALTAGGAISGTVQVEPGSYPMIGEIGVFTTDGFLWNQHYTGDGSFLFQVVPPGSYKLIFGGPNSAPEWYQDKMTLETADTVTVTSGLTTTVTALVSPTGFITGVITSELSPTQVIPGGRVRFYTEVAGDYWYNGFTYADASGVYTFPNSTATVWYGLGGPHFVRFSAIGYQDELYDDIKSWGSVLQGDPVTVTPGLATTVNAALLPYGTACITGTVFGVTLTGTTGVLSDTELNLFDYNPNFAGWEWWDGTVSDSAGQYGFCGLPNGTYRLLAGLDGDFDPDFEYFDPSDPIIPNAWQWYNDAGLLSAATNIVISNGISRTIDVNMDLGACIQGQILGRSGTNDIRFDIQDVEGVYVPFFGAGASFEWTGWPYDQEGHVLACGLPSGVYTFNCYGWDPLTGADLFGQEEATLTAGSSDPTPVTCQLMMGGVYLPTIRK